MTAYRLGGRLDRGAPQGATVNEQLEEFWQSLEASGLEETSKRLGERQYAGVHADLAREWIAHKRASELSALGVQTLEEARAASSLAHQATTMARSANDIAWQASSLAESANECATAAKVIAKESGDALRAAANAAKANNAIATLALIVAVIAIAISAWQLFMR